FTRGNGIWTQQGNKLTGAGGAGTRHALGGSVTLSGDGATAMFGGTGDSTTGATWVFRRTNGTWSQLGAPLVGAGSTINSFSVMQGRSIALSSDGTTAIIGGDGDNNLKGAVWIFTQPHFTISAPSSATVGTPINVTVSALDPNNAPFPGYTGPVH